MVPALQHLGLTGGGRHGGVFQPSRPWPISRRGARPGGARGAAEGGPILAFLATCRAVIVAIWAARTTRRWWKARWTWCAPPIRRRLLLGPGDRRQRPHQVGADVVTAIRDCLPPRKADWRPRPPNCRTTMVGDDRSTRHRSGGPPPPLSGPRLTLVTGDRHGEVWTWLIDPERAGPAGSLGVTAHQRRRRSRRCLWAGTPGGAGRASPAAVTRVSEMIDASAQPRYRCRRRSPRSKLPPRPPG